MYLILICARRRARDERSLNPYSNGTMYLINFETAYQSQKMGLNPYSNGTMYLMR